MKQENQHDSFSALLAKQAAEQSPVFSPILHERIMQRIQSSSIAPRQSSRSTRLWPIVSAAAAAMVAVVLLLPVLHSNPAHHPPAVAARLPEFPRLQVDALSQPLDDRLADARFAYLDRDAIRVVRYLKNQVDVVPAPRQ
jgi:hypothetical protein